MSPAQSRAARALLDLTQPSLASLAGIGLSTVVDYERARRAVSAEAIGCIRTALESAGIIFVEENGEGPGVRLRKAGKRADDHRKPSGPATDAIKRMEADITKDKAKRKR